jgi:hypothetical protein
MSTPRVNLRYSLSLSPTHLCVYCFMIYVVAAVVVLIYFHCVVRVRAHICTFKKLKKKKSPFMTCAACNTLTVIDSSNARSFQALLNNQIHPDAAHAVQVEVYTYIYIYELIFILLALIIYFKAYIV